MKKQTKTKNYKSTKWMLNDVPYEARNIAWKMAKLESMTIGEWIGELILKFDYIKKVYEKENPPSGNLNGRGPSRIEHRDEHGNIHVTFVGKDELSIAREIIRYQIKDLKKDAGLEPFKKEWVEYKKPWWKRWL